MKKLFFLFMCISGLTYAQENKSTKVGKTTLEELKTTVYDKDSSAVALVLYEHANFYLNTERKKRFKTDYYYRIKILKKEGLEKGVHTFGVSKDDRLSDVKAITYNLDEENSESIITSELKQEKIIKDDVNEYFTKVILTLPNVKVGSVVEFQYSIVSASPAIGDWYYQSDIPKLRSQITKSVPKYLDHVVRLRGILKVSDKQFKDGVRCFPNKKRKGICNYSTFIMDSIPKFEEELLMPDPYDYVSAISFRVSRYSPRNYVPYNMMRSWSQFHMTYQSYFFNREKTKQKFYKKIVPDSIKTGKNKLEIAKKLYTFVQNHYTWNGYRGGDSRSKLQKKFKKKIGSIDLINMSLFNSLKAAGIEVHYAVLSTRGNGLPEKVFPIMEDFNYSVVKAIIDEKEYFLDAADKKLSFGNISPKALNGEARIIEYNKRSYWQKINPLNKSSKKTTVFLSIDDEGEFYGKLKLIHSGYNSYYTRYKYEELKEEKYIEDLEQEIDDISIEKFKISNVKDLNRSVVENIDFYLEDTYAEEIVGKENIIRFNPILFDQLSVNPFKFDKRLYPLDFVFTFSNTYRITFQAPEGYRIVKTPKSIGYKLPNDGGFYSIKTQLSGNKITILVKLDISKSLFSSQEYYYLKELYYKIVNAESSYIELEKIAD